MDYIRSVVSNVATAWHLTDWTISVEGFENGRKIEQNYYGVLVPLDLVGKSKGAEIHLRLVLKLAPTEERYRMSGRMPVMFAHEIVMYSMVLQRYHESRLLNLMPECIAPKCFYVCRDAGKEAIVMQDMCFEGYQPFVNCIFIDNCQMRVALESLARFHACSFILKERDMNTYTEAIKVCEPITSKSQKRNLRLMKRRLDQALENFEATSYEPVLLNLSENLVKFVEAISKTRYTCICHGELWKENILFKYEVLSCSS